MNLNLVWLLLGITTAATLSSLSLTSDYLGIVLPLLGVALSIVTLLIGSRTGGLGFFRGMVVPVGIGDFFLLDHPLSALTIMPLIFGIWFGLANRLLAQPLSLLAFTGQVAVVVSADLLFWRHLGTGPLWGIAGMAVYAALSHRPGGRRVILCG